MSNGSGGKKQPALLPRAVDNAQEIPYANTCSIGSENENNSPDEDELVVHTDVDVLLPSSLPDEVLKILGDDPNTDQNDTFMLHEQTVLRWQNILINGLKKPEASNLLGSFTIPTNLPNLNPPKLDPEVKAALPKQNFTVDSSYVEVQN